MLKCRTIEMSSYRRSVELLECRIIEMLDYRNVKMINYRNVKLSKCPLFCRSVVLANKKSSPAAYQSALVRGMSL
jgi:hypothetical protein